MSTAQNEMLTELMRQMGHAALAASVTLSLASTQTKNQALTDVFWELLNSSEFLFNH